MSTYTRSLPVVADYREPPKDAFARRFAEALESEARQLSFYSDMPPQVAKEFMDIQRRSQERLAKNAALRLRGE